MSDWEDGPPPTDWVVLTTWIGGAVLSLVIYALAGWAIVSLLGCATGRVVTSPTNEVEVTCAAIGEGAEVVYFAPETSGLSVGWTPVGKTVTCKGGPLLPSFIGAIGGVFKVILGLFAVVP